MNILFVDDDPGFRAMLFAHLHHRHNLSVLCNGHNALSLLADPQHGFDVVLLDLKMPRLQGTNVVNALADWCEVGVKFVIISGLAEEATLLKLPNVVGVLRKPFGLTELDQLLASVSSAPSPAKNPVRRVA